MGVDVGKRDSPFYQARKALQVEEEKEQRHVVSWSGLRSGIGKLDESPFHRSLHVNPNLLLVKPNRLGWMGAPSLALYLGPSNQTDRATELNKRFFLFRAADYLSTAE